MNDSQAAGGKKPGRRPYIEPAKRGQWIVFFGEDWGGHNSTLQYLATELARDTCVLWVNSIGLRSPRFTVADAGRAVRKLAQFLRGRLMPREKSGNENDSFQFVVLAPMALPWYRFGWIRRLNRVLVGSVLRREARHHGIVSPIVVTACPATADVVDVLQPRRITYYCADEHGSMPGMNPVTVARLEDDLLAQSDGLVVTSRELGKRKARAGVALHYLPHGVDWERMSAALEMGVAQCPGDIADLPRPIAGFVGQISSHVDTKLIEHAARELPNVQFVLIGPQAVEDTTLPHGPNIVYLGPRPHAQLPGYLAAFDVAMMPFVDSERVKFAHPTKVREYLAAGCPVVATSHPELLELSSYIRFADSPEDFSAAIQSSIDASFNPREISAPMQEHTWRRRAVEFRAMIGIESVLHDQLQPGTEGSVQHVPSIAGVSHGSS